MAEPPARAWGGRGPRRGAQGSVRPMDSSDSHGQGLSPPSRPAQRASWRGTDLIFSRGDLRNHAAHGGEPSCGRAAAPISELLGRSPGLRGDELACWWLARAPRNSPKLGRTDSPPKKLGGILRNWNRICFNRRAGNNRCRFMQMLLSRLFGSRLDSVTMAAQLSPEPTGARGTQGARGRLVRRVL